MTFEEPPEPAGERPVFPYHVLWPGYGNAFVDLQELLNQVYEYRILADTVAQARHDVPAVTEEHVAKVLAKHDIGSDNILSFWVIACFHVVPAQIEAFGIDPTESRKALLRAARHASKLAQSLECLSPKVEAALCYIRPSVEGAIIKKQRPFITLYTEAHDFAETAWAAAADLSRSEGRPRHHRRDTMFRLLIELIEDIGLDDLKVSNGTKARPDFHLCGAAGALMLDMTHLVEPSWTEPWIAQRVKAVRAKMRKAHSAGAKTRPT